MADEATQDAVDEAVDQDQNVADQSTAGDGQEASTEVNWQEKFEAQKKVNRDLERKLKGDAGTLRTQIEELQAKLDGREAEYAEQAARREAEAEALSKANARILRSEVLRAAKGALADPADALLHLSLDQFEVSDDGDVDADAIAAAVDSLVSSKPYLAAQGGKRFQGSADSGAKAPTPAKTADEQIAEAEKAGDFALAGRLKAIRLTEIAQTT